MYLINIAPVRNEDWCLGLTARALLQWVDAAVFLVHASHDRTLSILQDIRTETRVWEQDANGDLTGEYTDRVHILEEPDPTWREMDQRQRLLDRARELGATHIATVDADEILCGDMLPAIRTEVERLAPRQFNGIRMRNLIGGIDHYRAESGPWGEGAGTMLAFRDQPSLGWASRNGYDHHQRSPRGSSMGHYTKGSGLMHLQFASRRRLLAKHAYYQCIERIKYPQKSVSDIRHLYTQAPSTRGIQAAECPAEWWKPYRDIMRHLSIDAEPWQEREVAALIEKHGREYFRDLDLFESELSLPALAQ